MLQYANYVLNGFDFSLGVFKGVPPLTSIKVGE
ncbi:hypothetical protein X928_10275 [Petrotoga miotherma DSM 10691]|uniref:Uncharacterized protein n=1 Tax=Petrotoga miotherma DSM 10691 TaxID=1434326 RepID=A0A2K1P3N1_9BACT|nr:hypothetical protein X928_10275 [Petrotoga miotherma DSM 10691]